MFANFKVIKMCLDVEYNSDSFWIYVWVLNFLDWKKKCFIMVKNDWIVW
jgi:hypothetical protein